MSGRERGEKERVWKGEKLMVGGWEEGMREGRGGRERSKEGTGERRGMERRMKHA